MLMKIVTDERLCLFNSKWGKETFKQEASRERGGVFITSPEFKGASVSDWLLDTPPPPQPLSILVAVNGK